MRSFIRSKVTEGSQILNLGHVTLTTPTLGVICHPMANTVRVLLNMCTKYEVSSLNRSKDIEGSQNLHIY